MTAFDLTIIQGNTFTLTLGVKDTSGNPLDLSMSSISGYYRNTYSSTGYVSLHPSGIIPSSGVIELSLTAEETSLLPVGIGVYDIRVTDSNDNSFKVLAGHAYVYPEVTY